MLSVFQTMSQQVQYLCFEHKLLIILEFYPYLQKCKQCHQISSATNAYYYSINIALERI